MPSYLRSWKPQDAALVELHHQEVQRFAALVSHSAAVRVDDQARRVDLLRQAVHLRRKVEGVIEFISHAPGNDGRVIAVQLDDGFPMFEVKPFGLWCRGQVPAIGDRKLRLNHHAQLVGHIEVLFQRHPV